MSPVTVLSQMYPITSGCIARSVVDAATPVTAAMATQTLNSVIERTALLPGAVWHGVQTLVDLSPACEDAYPHSVDFSLQLVTLNGTQAVFVLSGNAWDLLANNATGYCVFQQLMAGTLDRERKTVALTEVLADKDGVNYFSCSDDAFPVKASLQQYVYANNGFHLTGVHADSCVTSSLDAAPAV